VNPHTGKRRIDEAFPQEIREGANEQEMLIKLRNGSTWQIVGSDRYDSLVGAGVAGVVFSEWALANPSSWGYIRPMVEESNGWAAFITTPRGMNHAHAMYEMARDNPRWFAEISSVDDTGALTKEQLEEAKKELIALYGLSFGQAMYEQEYLCSFQAAIIGAYYARELEQADREGRFVENLYDPTMEVHTAWDIGLNDQTVITFWQQKAFDIRIVDCYAANGFGLDHYAKILDQRGYKYGRHVWPHDGGNGDWSAVGGRSRVETAREMGLDVEVLPKGGVEDGINAVRRIMPKVWIDRIKCKDLISALQSYRKQWDDKKKCFLDRPLHDWTSDYADSFRYLASAVEEPTADAAYTPKRSFKWVV
jgi:phage terminase large subunit